MKTTHRDLFLKKNDLDHARQRLQLCHGRARSRICTTAYLGTVNYPEMRTRINICICIYRSLKDTQARAIGVPHTIFGVGDMYTYTRTYARARVRVHVHVHHGHIRIYTRAPCHIRIYIYIRTSSNVSV
jgi:hypothetical protein